MSSVMKKKNHPIPEYIWFTRAEKPSQLSDAFGGYQFGWSRFFENTQVHNSRLSQGLAETTVLTLPFAPVTPHHIHITFSRQYDTIRVGQVALLTLWNKLSASVFVVRRRKSNRFRTPYDDDNVVLFTRKHSCDYTSSFTVCNHTKSISKVTSRSIDFRKHCSRRRASSNGSIPLGL